MSELDHNLRHDRITGSVAAACLGLDPWTTPMEAWMRIRTKGEPHDPDWSGDISPMERGLVLEGSLVRYGRRAAEQKFGDLLFGVYEPTKPHPECEWAAASVDAVYYTIKRDDPKMARCDRYLSEAKSVAWSEPLSFQWGAAWTDEVPRHVKIQCQFNMWHYPTTVGTVVPTLIGSGLAMRCYYVPRDDEAIEALKMVLEEWHWEHVIKGKPPGTRAGDLEVIAKAFPKPVLIAHEDDPAIAELAKLDLALRKEIAEKTDARDGIRAELAMRLRDYELCEGEWGRVLFRPTNPGPVVNYRALVEDMISDGYDLQSRIEQNTHPGKPQRPLRTYGPKGE